MRTVESAQVQYALAFGTREERHLAEQLVQAIGEAVLSDLSASGVRNTQIQQADLPSLVSRGVRESLERYVGTDPLNAEAWDLLSQYLDEYASIRLALDRDAPYVNEIAQFYGYAAQDWPFEQPLYLESNIFADRERVNEILATCGDRVLPIILDAGRGARQGLLSLVCASKGKITVFGRELRSLAVRSLALTLVPPPVSKQWCAVLPCDAIFLPGPADHAVLQNQLISGPDMFVFTKSPHELEFFGEDFTTEELWGKLLLKGLLSLRRRNAEKVVRGLARGGLVFHRRFAFQETGGDQLPSGRLITVEMLHSILDSYNEAADDGNPFWNRRPTGEEFFWFNRVTTAMRTSLDEWRLLWTPETGFSPADWVYVWRKENDFRRRTGGIWYPGVWLNANTPIAIHALYRNAAQKNPSLLRARIRGLLELPQEQEEIQSTIEGEVVFEGEHLLYRSRIRVPPGVRLMIGKRVVLDRSLIELEVGSPGDIVRIPENTVIVESHIKGTLRGEGPSGLVYRAFSNDDGLEFHRETVQTTLWHKDGEQETFRHPLDYQPGSGGIGWQPRASLDLQRTQEAFQTLMAAL